MNTLQNQVMQSTFVKLSVFALLSFLVGCSSLQTGKNGNWEGFTESGQASFYGNKHQNKKTASGELYQHKLKTAAHKKIPFGSNVKVTNVKNGKSVIVEINDRGPFVRGRIIDLSKSAFSSIGNTSSGLIDVKIEVIK
ncbi:septal ring lytic transglycosylase RlpA family protein [Shewanella profunda]|uniref:septal ring lytic transglycosylase RlpA family protein n=1 Tax=Shewanella profunda TaxID=254793 RepID=UPI00200BC13A|nr:septal ring lytic transglycosylase RlpA family protein [Shewanella profunda]MCL1090585.1 septal ring lytic transglycosylase RlpA family protein [Shewanella profunda]